MDNLVFKVYRDLLRKRISRRYYIIVEVIVYQWRDVSKLHLLSTLPASLGLYVICSLLRPLLCGIICVEDTIQLDIQFSALLLGLSSKLLKSQTVREFVIYCW